MLSPSYYILYIIPPSDGDDTHTHTHTHLIVYAPILICIYLYICVYVSFPSSFSFFIFLFIYFFLKNHDLSRQTRRHFYSLVIYFQPIYTYNALQSNRLLEQGLRACVRACVRVSTFCTPKHVCMREKTRADDKSPSDLFE
jgi:hypothetical protein